MFCCGFMQKSDICTRFQTISYFPHHWKRCVGCQMWNTWSPTLAVIGHQILAHNVPWTNMTIERLLSGYSSLSSIFKSFFMENRCKTWLRNSKVIKLGKKSWQFIKVVHSKDQLWLLNFKGCKGDLWRFDCWISKKGKTSEYCWHDWGVSTQALSH